MATQGRPIVPRSLRVDALLAHAVPAAVACLTAIALLDLLGSHVLGEPTKAFDLDSEHNVPSTFSSLLFATAVLAAAGVFRATPKGAPGRTAAITLAGVLAFMGIDEWVMLHERLDWPLGVHWTVWYLPIVGTAIGAGVRLSRAYPVARRPLAFTFGAWFLAGLLEMASWDPDRSMQPWGAVLVEETLEMLAAFALIVGLGRALRVARSPSTVPS